MILVVQFIGSFFFLFSPFIYSFDSFFFLFFNELVLIHSQSYENLPTWFFFEDKRQTYPRDFGSSSMPIKECIEGKKKKKRHRTNTKLRNYCNLLLSSFGKIINFLINNCKVELSKKKQPINLIWMKKAKLKQQYFVGPTIFQYFGIV